MSGPLPRLGSGIVRRLGLWRAILAARLRHQLVKQARLALVEALGVKGIREPQISIVDVVAELVEQGAEVRPERDHAALACGAHPELDTRQTAIGRVEALQLSPAAVRT